MVDVDLVMRGSEAMRAMFQTTFRGGADDRQGGGYTCRNGSLPGSIFARTFVYEKVRPFFLGTPDYTVIYAWLGDVRGQRMTWRGGRGKVRTA